MSLRPASKSRQFSSSIKYTSTRKGAKPYQPYLDARNNTRWARIPSTKIHRGRTYRLVEAVLPKIRWEDVTPTRGVPDDLSVTSPQYSVFTASEAGDDYRLDIGDNEDAFVYGSPSYWTYGGENGTSPQPLPTSPAYSTNTEYEKCAAPEVEIRAFTQQPTAQAASIVRPTTQSHADTKPWPAAARTPYPRTPYYLKDDDSSDSTDWEDSDDSSNNNDGCLGSFSSDHSEYSICSEQFSL
jgi:hypothetical protein